MRPRRLKIKLLSIAFAAGLCISLTLFALEYLDYRKAGAVVGIEGAQSLLHAEAQRLDEIGKRLIDRNTRAITDALKNNDAAALARIGSQLLKSSNIIAVTIVELKQDVVFFDPPWGGPDYHLATRLDMFLGPRNIIDIVASLVA